MDDEDTFSDSQQLIMATSQRVAAGISFCCACLMAKAAFSYRARVYHRFMLGLSCHLILYAVWSLWGAAAVPEGTPGSRGARGNTATCSVQGFGKQVSFSVSFYYVLLSLYSFQAVKNNFVLEKYLWIEKWIHLLVNIIPLTSAIYLVSIEAFNFTGSLDCWIASIPFGCGKDTGIECERGPQHIEQIAGLFAALPVFFVLVFPTCIMTALYFTVRRQQDRIKLEAASVAKQSALYLLALYWSYIFSMINNGIQWQGNRKVFVTALMATANLNLQGVWFHLIYLHFRVSNRDRSSAGEAIDKSAASAKRRLSENSLDDQCLRTTFNIFDGSNAAGAFSEFIFEGDSDDERVDRRESVQWNAVQSHI